MARNLSFYLFKVLVSPSWTETVIVTVIAVSAMLAVSLPLLYDQTHYATYLNLETASQTDIYKNITSVTDAVSSSTFASTASVFMFWAFVGIVTFFLVDSLLRSITSVQSFLDTIHHPGSNKTHLEVEGIMRLGIRVAAAAGLYLLYSLFIARVLPTVLLWAHKALSVTQLMAALYILGGILLLMVMQHMAVIFTRLLCLRVRVFSDPLSAV